MKNKQILKNRWFVWALAANAFAAIALLGLANYVSLELEEYALEESWLVVQHGLGQGGNKKFWPVYRNEDYGFEMKFPNTWIAKDTTGGASGVDFEISIYTPDSSLALSVSKSQKWNGEDYVFKTFFPKENFLAKQTIGNILSTFKFLD